MKIERKTLKNGKLTSISQTLRKEQTPEEKRLWYKFFKKIPVTVNRQKVMGEYIVDFYCSDKKLVIEIDGKQHKFRSGVEEDKIRDEFFASLGISVLRVVNKRIRDGFYKVCEELSEILEVENPISF